MSESITFTLNGNPAAFEVELRESALELIHTQTGLRGTKLACGSGVCGACTIQVNKETVCSCLMPAVQLDGKDVETIEAYAGRTLHAVQRAFLAHDALQCGYCTPGFIQEGIAFYRRWRAEKGDERPSREEIAEAMAGHLCRCGAYQGIYNAVAEACEGKFETVMMPDYQRVDGLAKVSGAAMYTTDMRMPGRLVGAMLRSPYPHAEIVSMDLGKALAMEGVKAVLRLKPDNEIKYEGEPLVGIAAENELIAHAAMKAVAIEYKVLPFVVDPRLACKPGAPLVHGEDKKGVPVASEGPAFPGKWEGNLRKTSFSLSASGKGKAKRKLDSTGGDAKLKYSAVFSLPTQFHTALEPHCAMANWPKDDHLHVWVSTQSVYWIAKELAKHYGLKEENVVVVAEHVGGAFGAKLALHTETLVAADLARAAKAPVYVTYSRAEELNEAGYRPAVDVDLEITADADGQNAAYRMKAYGSAGVAIGSNVADVSGLGYTGISKDLQDYDVVTHFAPGSAFRGPGGPAACFALEQGIDQLAEQLGMDALGFRRKWEKHEGYLALFDWVEKSELWQKRGDRTQKSGRFRRGVGLAFGGWMHLYMPSAEVEVKATNRGIFVSCAVQDMGQGARSVMAMAVAEVFALPTQLIQVEAGASYLSIGPASGGSRTATSIYPAAKEAALLVRDRLVKETAKRRGLSDVKIVERGITHSGGFNEWGDILVDSPDIVEKVKRGRNDGFNPMGLVPLAQGLVLGKDRAYGCYVIEVEVDTLLGKVRVTNVEGALRVGKIHVKPNAESQCYGGVIQGIGHALYEDRALCPTTGRILTRNLEDYRIPGIGDMPQVKMHFIEEGFDFVKEKGIGLAELCTTPVAGAVANAVYNATGWRPMSAPIRPEHVLAGLASL